MSTSGRTPQGRARQGLAPRRHEMRWKLLILTLTFLAVGCAMGINAPRGVLVRPNVVNRPAPQARAVLTVVGGPRLDHSKHVELGLECADCHELDEATGIQGYPEVDVCLDCHEDMQEDDEVPEAQRIENVYFDGSGHPRWKKAVQGPGADVRFSHGPHVAAKLECSACHDMAENRRYGRKLLSKPECLQCHRQRSVSTACSTCHLRTRREISPPSHAAAAEWKMGHGKTIYESERAGTDPKCQFCHQDAGFCTDCHQRRKPPTHAVDWQRRHGQVVWQMGGPEQARCTFCHRDRNYCDGCHQTRLPDSHRHLWMQRHGVMAKAGDMSGMARCDFCHHQPAFCEDCHRDQEPRDHTAIFRTRTHGLAASIDRTRCRTCHQADFCVRCHENTPPRSHRGLWARGRTTHCITCHFPVQREPQCAVCHKQSPTHDTAPSMPGTHGPGWTCRACHNPVGNGGAPPLRHVDNGMPCQFCHD